MLRNDASFCFCRLQLDEIQKHPWYQWVFPFSPALCKYLHLANLKFKNCHAPCLALPFVLLFLRRRLHLTKYVFFLSIRGGRNEPCPEQPPPRRVCLKRILSLTELDPDVLESMYSLGCFRDRVKLTQDLTREEWVHSPLNLSHSEQTSAFECSTTAERTTGKKMNI